MAKLTLMMGCPGAGKSTYIKNLGTEGVYVSRDEIRFSIVSENEEYFSKEKEVYRTFVNKIIDNLKCGNDVYADATHLNRGSRNKLLRSINHHDYDELGIIWIKVPLETAIARNENRKGTRAYVPPHVVESMYNSLVEPSYDEGFDTILIINNESE